jgi:hypothetical protein
VVACLSLGQSSWLSPTPQEHAVAGAQRLQCRQAKVHTRRLAFDQPLGDQPHISGAMPQKHAGLRFRDFLPLAPHAGTTSRSAGGSFACYRLLQKLQETASVGYVCSNAR